MTGNDKPVSNDYSNLSKLDQALAHTGARPRSISYLATFLAVVIGWVWITFLSAGVTYYSSTPLGPGMGIMRPFLDWVAGTFGNSPLVSIIIRLCTPQIIDDMNLTSFLGTFSMWFAMSVAMMLPSAAPMLRTYGDIAHVARSKGEETVSLLVLALGYLFLWAAFSASATLVQLALVSFAGSGDLAKPLGGLVGGMILIAAGVYQFTPLKDACLEKCRNPFTTLFAQWTDRPWGVFRLGMGQGMFCVGCCWALMLVMLVVGTMNLAWMAFFTLFAILEKSGAGKVTSRITGCILIVWGGILVLLV